MNGARVRMLFAFCIALLFVAGCSDSMTTDKPDEKGKLAGKDFLELEERAQVGDAAAQFELGRMYSDTAADMFPDLSSLSDADLQALIEEFDQGSEEPGKVTDKFTDKKWVAKANASHDLDRNAVSWWRKAAEQGHAAAQLSLGWAYHKGRGVPNDSSQAAAWYRKAAEHGIAAAQFNLGGMYRSGDGVSRDDRQAVMWYRKAAEQGDKDAQFSLGEAYSQGRGIPKDLSQAALWWHKAAEQGDTGAQFYLGWMYDNGKGVPKDDIQAVAWYRKAAEQGHTGAQFYLGVMYDNGEGVPKDDVQAVTWYRKAAGQGHKDAQNNLGAAYDNGEGVPRETVRAYMWFNLAAAQGDKHAIRNRDIVSRRMSSDQIAEAQRLTREWKPGQHTESAATPSGPDDGLEKVFTGTAFIVSSQGHLLTNRHVVADCKQVRLAGGEQSLKVLPQDAANDLALLQMTDKPKAVAVFRAEDKLRQGESIAVYGYPLHGALAAGGNLSPGAVSALAGLGNNTSHFQITAPVQPGNSGGPVLDGKGHVVGMVVQKLDAVKVARITGDVPQNVNFAINESTTRAFLDSNQVDYKTGNWWNLWQKDLADIAEGARGYTLVVECWR